MKCSSYDFRVLRSEEWEEGWGARINVRVVSGPAVDLGEEHNLDHLLGKGRGDKDCGPDPEPKVVPIVSCHAVDEEACVSIPVILPGSPHGECSDVGEDVSCEISVIEHDQEPSDADGEIVENATSKAGLVAFHPLIIVEN